MIHMIYQLEGSSKRMYIQVHVLTSTAPFFCLSKMPDDMFKVICIITIEVHM